MVLLLTRQPIRKVRGLQGNFHFLMEHVNEICNQQCGGQRLYVLQPLETICFLALLFWF